MFNQIIQEDEKLNFQNNCNNDLINTSLSSQGFIITEEEDQFLDISKDAFKINQNFDVQIDHSRCENELQISYNQNKQTNPQSDNHQQEDETNNTNVLEYLCEKSNNNNNNQEEIILNQNSDFIDKNVVVYLKEEQTNQNQKIETIKEQMDHIESEYQISIYDYQEKQQKELFYHKEQQQIKLNENELFLNNFIDTEKRELTKHYKKQIETVNNIIENKKQIIQQQLDKESMINLIREKIQMVQQLQDNSENYKQQRQKQNQSKLNLLQQNLYLNRIINMKKIFQKMNLDLNKTNQIEISEKMKPFQSEFNQFRIQSIESIEQNIQLLDQQNIIKLNKEKEIFKKEYNFKNESQKNKLNCQIIQQQNKNKLIDKNIKQILQNQLIERRNIREQQFQKEIKIIQNREFELSSYLNLDCKDKEVEQIKIDNLKQYLSIKQKLNDRLNNNLDKYKKDIQNKYQIMKSNLVELYIEKLEKQKSLHENNRQNRLILEVFQDINKKQKFIYEISENIKILEINKSKIEQQLENLQMTTYKYSLQNGIDQINKLNSDLKQLNDHLNILKLEDQEITKELQILQSKSHKLVSNHQYKQYKSQIIYYILQNINELNDLFNDDDNKIDLNQDFEIFKISQQEQINLKIEPQIPFFMDHFDEINLKQMKKWMAFLLNQRIIWILEDEMCRREKGKLKSMGIKLNKNINDIEKEFKQQNIIKKENEFKLDFLEKQGQMLKYQQSQIVAQEKKTNEWRQVLRYKKKVLDRMNLYIADQIPIQKKLDALQKFYTQYIQIQQDNDNLPQPFQFEDLNKYKFELPSQYSYISQQQNFDLQYILLI